MIIEHGWQLQQQGGFLPAPAFTIAAVLAPECCVPTFLPILEASMEPGVALIPVGLALFPFVPQGGAPQQEILSPDLPMYTWRLPSGDESSFSAAGLGAIGDGAYTILAPAQPSGG